MRTILSQKKEVSLTFFSWELYKHIKSRPDKLEVWLSHWCPLYGFNHPEGENRLTMMIGSMDEFGFSGQNLRQRCTYRADRTICHYPKKRFQTDKWKNITNEFWGEYKNKGVCAIHGDLVHNWEIENNTRTCRYCGKKESLRFSFEIKRHEIWEPE